MKFAEWAKAYAALVGLIGAGVIGLQDMPTSWKLPLEIVVIVAGAVTTWAIPNKTEDPDPSDFDFDPPAPNWKSAGPAWDEPVSPEDPKSPNLLPPDGEPFRFEVNGEPLNVIPIRRRETNGAPVYRLAA